MWEVVGEPLSMRRKACSGREAFRSFGLTVLEFYAADKFGELGGGRQLMQSRCLTNSLGIQIAQCR